MDFISSSLLRMISSFRKKIFFKIFFFFILATSIPALILLTISYVNTMRVTTFDFMNYKETLTEQIARSIDENVGSMQKESKALVYNFSDISQFLSYRPETIDENYIAVADRVTRFLISILSNNDRFDGIGLADIDGKISKYADFHGFIPLENAQIPKSCVEQTIAKKGDALLCKLDLYDFMQNAKVNPESGNNKVIVTMRLLYNYINDNQPIGISFFTQGYTKFGGIVTNGKLVEDESLLILADDNTVIFANHDIPFPVPEVVLDITRKNSANKKQFSMDYRDYYLIYNSTSSYGFQMISLIPKSVVTDKLAVLQKINVTLLIVTALTIMFVSIVLSNVITVPLKKLKRAFKQFERGNFNAFVATKGEDEFAEICKSYNQMITNVKRLIGEKYELQLLHNKSELEALQSKMNPHFLYNTLSSIKAVIQVQDSAQARQMIQDLSDIFRYTLNKGRFIVTISEELEHIKKYVALQKLRFGDHLQVNFDIDEELLSQSILRLSLQPLVENAIIHGLESTVKHGVIQISAKSYGKLIFIYVEDNGIGMESEKMEQINHALSKNPTLAGKDHVGIYNVNSRLKLYFGDEYGLQILDSSDEGTTLRITIPWVVESA